MSRLIACAVLFLSLCAFAPPAAPEDDGPHFPALQTTIVAPEADSGPLGACATLEGHRLCDEDLAGAWCRKQGFAKFVEWTTAGETRAGCAEDDQECAVVSTITCARVPIVGD